MFRLLNYILIALLFTACDNNVVFEDNVKLPDNRWEIKNAVTLEAQINDSVSLHNIYINVRNAGGFQFSNLYIFLTTETPSGLKARDTLELTLADASGKWLGDGLGDIWDNRILFMSNYRFPEKGKYIYTLEQAMRIDPLPQIMDVGIRIEKSASDQDH